MPGKRLVQFEKVPHTLEIQGRIGEQLKARYDVAEPIPDRLAELLKQLAQLELLKELTQLMDEPDSLGG
jgi:Anti-sigma factor NepR